MCRRPSCTPARVTVLNITCFSPGRNNWATSRNSRSNVSIPAPLIHQAFSAQRDNWRSPRGFLGRRPRPQFATTRSVTAGWFSRDISSRIRHSCENVRPPRRAASSILVAKSGSSLIVFDSLNVICGPRFPMFSPLGKFVLREYHHFWTVEIPAVVRGSTPQFSTRATVLSPIFPEMGIPTSTPQHLLFLFPRSRTPFHFDPQALFPETKALSLNARSVQIQGTRSFILPRQNFFGKEFTDGSRGRCFVFWRSQAHKDFLGARSDRFCFSEMRGWLNAAQKTAPPRETAPIARNAYGGRQAASAWISRPATTPETNATRRLPGPSNPAARRPPRSHAPRPRDTR